MLLPFVRRGNDMAYDTSGTEKKTILHSPSMIQIFQKANLLAYNQASCAYLRGKRRWKKAFWQNISRKVVLYLVNPL